MSSKSMSRRCIVVLSVSGVALVVVVAVTVILIIELKPHEDDGGSLPENAAKESNENRTAAAKKYCDMSKAETEICDGIKDCEDGLDEVGCEANDGKMCLGFRCSASMNETQCFPLNKICDGKKDCYDGMDETSCAGCDIGKFRCPSNFQEKTICIDRQRVCNGNADCPNATEEFGCAKWVGWGPWCRIQMGNDPNCLLTRDRRCQHTNGKIFNSSKECMLWDLNFTDNITIHDALPPCSQVPNLDPRQVELCPLYKSFATMNETKSEAARPLEAGSAVLSQDLVLLPGLLTMKEPRSAAIANLGSEPDVAATGIQDFRHTFSITFGCCAFVLCAITALATYFFLHRHQHRAYNVAKKEANGLPAGLCPGPPEGGGGRERVSTSSAV